MADHGETMCRQVDVGMTRVFELFGKRWTGLIVATLMPGPVHFADLRRAIPGISERMLSDRLMELAAAGLVVREVDGGRTGDRARAQGAVPVGGDVSR